LPGSLKSNLEYLDYLVGRICRKLEELGLAEDTVIFFAGDNATAGYGKHRLESELGPRVPFVVYGPGRVPAMGPRRELIDFSDVLPTVLDLADTSLPAGYEVDGASFAPLLRGEDFQGRDWIFTQMGEARWLRDDRWLLDGKGRFYESGQNRDETAGYRDVTLSDDAEVITARMRFEEILQDIPPIDYDHPETKQRWDNYLKAHGKLEPYRPPYLEG
jgi:arylsulfatase A-like enzyme